ncbi:hypothetical protein GCM10023144_47840 [Pigmentiphaga soli]|uniref:DUF2242 domain-containing protein n=1 Tax=Pigmentiphaga soli TaxID=1007095 RepID=A0ABP8HTM1_9BURK
MRYRSTSFHSSLTGALAASAATALFLAGCAHPQRPIYDHEAFEGGGTYSRPFDAANTAACEAARRALLSQGYVVYEAAADKVNARKSFQPDNDQHIEIDFHVVCTADAGNGRATVFANALQDRFALKKNANSASVGVGVLGSVSMPFGNSDDSMVKVASETITQGSFYERFFGLVEQYVQASAGSVVQPTAEAGAGPQAAPPAAPALPAAPPSAR